MRKRIQVYITIHDYCPPLNCRRTSILTLQLNRKKETTDSTFNLNNNENVHKPKNIKNLHKKIVYDGKVFFSFLLPQICCNGHNRLSSTLKLFLFLFMEQTTNKRTTSQQSNDYGNKTMLQKCIPATSINGLL